MNLATYKIFIKNETDKYPRLKAGELSVPLINDFAKGFKMPIDAEVFKLFSRYNKEQLENFARKLKIHTFLQRNISILSNLEGNLPIVEIVQQKTWTKMDWAFMIYALFKDQNLFEPFLATMQKPVHDLWQALVWTSEMSASQVEEIVGKNPVVTQTSDIHYARRTVNIVLDDYLPFARESNNSSYYEPAVYIFSIPAPVRVMQKPFVAAPKESILTPITTLGDCKIFESENLAFQDIPRTLAYHSQGNIKLLSSGRPNAASSNKMRKALSLQEFYSDDKELESLRTHCLANWIVYAPMKQISVGTPVIEVVKVLYERLKLNHINPFAVSLTQLKGFSNIEDHLTTKNDWHTKAFKQLAQGEWYAVENFRKFLFYNEYDFVPIGKNDAKSYLKYKGMVAFTNYSYEDNIGVSYDYYPKMILDNYVNAFVFMLAAIGAVDIAYKKPDTTKFAETFFSDFEGLYAFRLNAFGAHLLGKNANYEAPVKEDATNLAFDENELIILGKAEDKLTDTLLLNYVQKAGANRYIVTAQSFLKDCKNSKQIKDKIALFKQTVGIKKLPDNWESFFQLLQQRAESVTAVTETYEIFELNKEDKELIRLIAQDRDFQKIVIKAEGFRVIVYKDKVSAFRTKLREYGYLLK